MAFSFAEHTVALQCNLECGKIMDDFAVGDVQPPPEPVSARGRKSRTSAASSSTGDKSRAKLCGYPECDNDCKQGRRHCGHHNRHLDNVRNQVSKKYGPEGLKAFSDKCRDMEFANSQIEMMAKKSIGLSMFARAPLIDFVAWEQEFGVLVETKTAQQTRPFEEKEWIIRQVKKFGRDEKEMEQEWKRKVAGPWKRDDLGYKGALRLWLPAVEYEEKSSTQFIKGAAIEQSKSKKAPKDFEKEAFRAHALESDLDHSHSFFGGVGHNTDENEDDAMKDEDEAPQAQPSTKSPQKRKAETLDASEDETEAASSSNNKKPRKCGNLSAARASFFEMASKTFGLKISSLQAKVEEAKKTIQDEQASVAPSSATDTTTRKLYKDALASSLEVVNAWLDPSTLTSLVEAHNNKDEVKASVELQVKTEPAESLFQQSPAWAWLASRASLHFARCDFIRSRSLMQKFVDDIALSAVDEAQLSKQRVIWRRMFACLAEMESLLKKSAADVARHVKAVVSAQERAVKKQKDKEAKDAAAKHLSSVQAKISKAKAEGSDMPGIFKLKLEELTSMKAVKSNTLPADMDVSTPLILKECAHVSTWVNNPTSLQILTNFGSRYKKVPTIEETGKVNQPMVAKAGNEQAEALFGEILNPVSKLLIDMSAIAQNWASTSWMFGMLPRRVLVGMNPNMAACLRLLSYGEVEVYSFSVSEFAAALKKNGLQVPASLTELEQAIVLAAVVIRTAASEPARTNHGYHCYMSPT